MKTWLIGVDEAGRGPLAGPVAVGVVKISADFDWEVLPGVNDSKQVTATTREAIYARAIELQAEGKLLFSVVQTPAAYIDARGIVSAIRQAMHKGIKQVKASPEDCHIKLDGALKAPAKFSQETIIKGDATEKVIGLASILAKVTRDMYMCRLAAQKTYAHYKFEEHKGYGTPEHRSLIAEHGPSDQHRHSYCQNQHMWGRL